MGWGLAVSGALSHPCIESGKESLSLTDPLNQVREIVMVDVDVFATAIAHVAFQLVNVNVLAHLFSLFGAFFSVAIEATPFAEVRRVPPVVTEPTAPDAHVL